MDSTLKIANNTILITGGGSGIGRAFAEAFHKRGNQVNISGRRKERLQATIDAIPGMAHVELDITNPKSIDAVVSKLLKDFPALNVLINNAGIMLTDGVHEAIDEELLTSTVTTNLLGPIRVTSALIDHLKTQPDAVIVNVTSVLGFVPMAAHPSIPLPRRRCTRTRYRSATACAGPAFASSRSRPPGCGPSC
jgi:uncharacterized oxidoreductase